MKELMKNVDAAYYTALPLKVCFKVWATAQMVMNEILLADGNNNYKLPHLGKDKIVRKLGKTIPLRLPCMAVLSKSPLNGGAIRSTMMADSEYYALHHCIISFITILSHYLLKYLLIVVHFFLLRCCRII